MILFQQVCDGCPLVAIPIGTSNNLAKECGSMDQDLTINAEVLTKEQGLRVLSSVLLPEEA